MSDTQVQGRAVRPCPACGKGTLRYKRNRQHGSVFVGCDQYPTCQYAENLTEVEKPPSQVPYDTVVQALAQAVSDLQQAQQELAGAKNRVQNLEYWYWWLQDGLFNLQSLMDPERWEYEALSVEVCQQIQTCLEYMFDDERRRAIMVELQARWRQLAQERTTCLNPACLGCAERRQAWRNPRDKRDIPCLEETEGA